MAVVSSYPLQLFIKHTFLQFSINRFDLEIHKRSESAPARTVFIQKKKTNRKKKTKRIANKNKDDVFKEFVHLTRVEHWAMFTERLIHRRCRIKEKWVHLSCKLVGAAPIKKKKYFTLTRRLFLNAAPWITPAHMLRAKKNGLLRPTDRHSMEFWASDSDLLSKSVLSIFSIFALFRKLMENEQMMMMLPSGMTFIFTYRRDLHLDELRAKVTRESALAYDKQRLVCHGQELQGDYCLGEFDVHPGDVITVMLT